MKRRTWSTNGSGPWLPVSVCALAFAVLILGTFSAASAAATLQKSFTTPEKAVTSLVAAVRDNDLKSMAVVLGPGSEELISSGDDVADSIDRKKFLHAYERKNKLREESPGKMTLCIGLRDWPMPIPILRKDTGWVFDAKEGKQEILNRRIGRNELYVIDVLHAYVDAQQEYATRDCSGEGLVQFARKLVSSQGKRDGLYWAEKQGEEPSPLGPLMAQAAKEGYTGESLSPFHGYYFKTLNRQGPHANGGAYEYVVKDKMLLGFALAAYPAEYGNSGVMTFIVNQEGVIYQKNLGEDTKSAAQALDAFDPDETWQRVEEPATKEQS